MGLKGATLSGFVESRQQVATASGYSTNILIRCQTITSTTTITRYSGRLLKLLMQILHQQLQHPHSWPTPRSAKHLSSSSLEELRIGFRRSQFSSVPAIQRWGSQLTRENSKTASSNSRLISEMEVTYFSIFMHFVFFWHTIFWQFSTGGEVVNPSQNSSSLAGEMFIAFFVKDGLRMGWSINAQNTLSATINAGSSGRCASRMWCYTTHLKMKTVRPLKSYRDPKGKDRLPTIIFQGLC